MTQQRTDEFAARLAEELKDVELKDPIEALHEIEYVNGGRFPVQLWIPDYDTDDVEEIAKEMAKAVKLKRPDRFIKLASLKGIETCFFATSGKVVVRRFTFYHMTLDKFLSRFDVLFMPKL